MSAAPEYRRGSVRVAYRGGEEIRDFWGWTRGPFGLVHDGRVTRCGPRTTQEGWKVVHLSSGVVLGDVWPYLSWAKRAARVLSRYDIWSFDRDQANRAGSEIVPPEIWAELDDLWRELLAGSAACPEQAEGSPD